MEDRIAAAPPTKHSRCRASCPGCSAAHWVRFLGRSRQPARRTADPGPRHKQILSLAVPVLQRTTTRQKSASCCAAPGTRVTPPEGNG
jgi:hypothetical protein